MKKRRLGKSELLVNPVGLGCMGFTHASGDPVPEAAAVRTLRAAYDIGYDYFDTAEGYTGITADGRTACNETVVGKAIRDIRDKVVLGTKMGVYINSDRSLRLDSRPETIRKAIDGSLKRLGTDYIDIYFQHRIDPDVEPETVAEVMGELIKAGKIRAWGISEANEEYLRRANAVTPVAAIENRYSMMARWHEKLFPVLEELHIAYIAFSPMANGFLTGKYTPKTKFEGKQDYRGGMPQYTEEGYAKAAPLLALLKELAAKKNCTMAELSLAWMIAKKPYIIPIPGSRKLERLKSNFAAAEISLTPEEVQSIDAQLDTMEFEVFGGHAARQD